MDKQKIIVYESKLFMEITVLSFLFKEKRKLTLSDILSSLEAPSYCENSINAALLKLVSHGLVNPNLSEKGVLYSASDFGIYFYEKLIQANEAFKCNTNK